MDIFFLVNDACCNSAGGGCGDSGVCVDISPCEETKSYMATTLSNSANICIDQSYEAYDAGYCYEETYQPLSGNYPEETELDYTTFCTFFILLIILCKLITIIYVFKFLLFFSFFDVFFRFLYFQRCYVSLKIRILEKKFNILDLPNNKLNKVKWMRVIFHVIEVHCRICQTLQVDFLHASKSVTGLTDFLFICHAQLVPWSSLLLTCNRISCNVWQQFYINHVLCTI